MSISTEEIQKIMHLARLADDQPEQLKPDLDKILEFVNIINNAETDDIEPMSHPLDVQQRFRTDEVTENDQRTLFQSLSEKSVFLVPKVIE